MGTRGFTQLVVDNKVLVQQYGQWDHYANVAGAHLVNFLKQPGNIEFLRGASSFVSPTGDAAERDELQFSQCMFGYEHPVWGDIENFTLDLTSGLYKKNTSLSEPESMQWFVSEVVNKFGFDMASKYLLNDRDIGYRIFDLIKALHEMRPEAILTTTVEEELITRNNDFGIHGVYTIYLRTDGKGEHFSIELHNKSMNRSLKQLPSEKALDRLEKME